MKGLLLLLRCSLYESCFDKSTPLRFFKLSPNVPLLFISLEVYKKFMEGLEPIFLLKDALIPASTYPPCRYQGCSRSPLPLDSSIVSNKKKNQTPTPQTNPPTPHSPKTPQNQPKTSKTQLKAFSAPFKSFNSPSQVKDIGSAGKALEQ